MKRALSGLAALFMLFAAGASEPQSGSFRIDNGLFSVTLDNPAAPDPGGRSGCRFLRPGWITALYPAGSRVSLFHTRSVSNYHPAFGCAVELLPELELAPGRQLKIGVGVIEPHPVSRFQPKPVELFPWQTKYAESGTKTVLTAHQTSGDRNGYAYELTASITITDGSPEIILEQELHNTGSRRITATAYLHPFFFTGEPESCRVRLHGEEFKPVFSEAPNTETVYRKNEGRREITAEFRTDRDCSVTLAADTPLDRSRLWHNGRDCFAAEPFITLDIAPGERRKWSFRLVIRTGKSN
ncbi:MAG: hypothetical protein HPZ91_18555 [Lentisphaeria bacterium]|nr:hypothetical protein [Lentisphaeria bacterium]